MKQNFFNQQFIFRSLAVLGLTGISLLTPKFVLSVGSVSPTIDASNGFPLSYTDARVLTVIPCIDGGDPKCVLPGAGEEPNFDPSKPTEFPINFMSEFFYWIAESDPIITPTGGKIFMRFAVEGAFLNEDPAAGDQMVFSRKRATGTELEPSATYTITHPYGVDVYETDATGIFRRNQSTEDIGCEAGPCDFSLALGGQVFNGFLKFDNGVPDGYLGDAVTPHTVTGSPTGNNFVRVEGPGLPAGGLQTNLFTISGKLAGNIPPPPPPAECTINTSPEQPVLASPIDGATEVAANPTLSWNALANFGTNCAGNNNQFELFIDPGNVDPTTSQGVFPGNQLSVAVTGLSENTIYSWKIRANNGALTTDSAVKTFTTVVPIPVIPPAAPSTLKANNMGATIRLTWVDNSNNETEFKILRKVGATGVFSQIATVLGDTAIFTDNAAPKGLIFYKVQACNITGCSDFSNTAIVFKATPLVAKPTNLRAVNNASGAQLSWRDNATTETQYIIEKRNSFQSAFTQLTILSSNAASFTDTTAVRGLNIYRVKACNVDSCSDYSNTAIVFKI